MSELTQVGFDYAALPVDAALTARAAAERIKLRLKRTVEDIIEIGRELAAVKEELPHGQFLPWIAAEFEMSRQTADNFEAVYKRFGNGKLLNFSNLKPSILYALSAPSTPESVIDKAVAKAESGEKVTVADVRDWKALEAELEIEKRRNREWMEQSKANRDKIRALELDLSAALDRPVPKPEIQVVEKTPADYEAFKARAVSMAEEIATLKKKQVDLVQQQVTAKLREREKEIAELDRQVRSAEALLASLNQQIDSYSSIERMTRLQRDLIEKTRSALVDLASHLEGLTPLENDPETDRLWDALADMLRNGAAAVEYFLGNAKPALTVIRGSAA
ncbi:DUF3102 domain-containing protein [Candidatus Accumulibacter vicinus]|uniref:DUF3102 domain-containing protein n=1 Tax=Candidatus Accumulibacter vicinus TaxID=2954382 RepID=A0A084XW09_9PROT|nr:DUF3102 domain-containing protein [Candidatus Accumulibacter vicinus]KFB66653.1 MAG: hypothetical protein CAPSK01_004018 [Candidatus Accumulibacter vicinus]